MKITKEDLKDIRCIELAFENCESFEILAEDVLDINFTKLNSKEGEMYAEEGFVLLSKNALNVISSITEDFDNNGGVFKEYYSLKNRVRHHCDLCCITVNYHDGRYDNIVIPFKPLEGGIQWFVEYTNCASAEITESGDLLILCGKMSKLNTRVDNNYKDLIVWFEHSIKRQFNDIMSVSIERFNTIKGITNNIEIECKVLNNGFAGKVLDLEFYDISDMRFALDFDRDNMYSLSMSRLQDGRIFVGISDIIEFKCRAIVDWTNAPYSTVGVCENVLDFKSVLTCDAMEEFAVKLAYNHCAVDMVIKAEYIVNAFEKVLSNKISLTYFRAWLKLLTDIMEYYICEPFLSDESMVKIRLELLRLYYELLYYKSTSECAELIESKYNVVRPMLSE